MNFYQTIKLILVILACGLYSASASAIISEASQVTHSEPTEFKTYQMAQGTGAGQPDETFWLTIKDTSLPELFEMFIKQYPNSPHSSEAASKLRSLKKGSASTASEEAEQLFTTASSPHQSASVTRSTSPDNPRAMARNNSELALLIQHNLNRVGCQAGSVDGAFGPRSQSAASRYAKHSGQALDTNSPNQGLLSAVQSAQGKVCPPVITKKVRYRPERSRPKTRNSAKAKVSRKTLRARARPPANAKPKAAPTAKKPEWNKDFFDANRASGDGGDGGGH